MFYLQPNVAGKSERKSHHHHHHHHHHLQQQHRCRRRNHHFIIIILLLFYYYLIIIISSGIYGFSFVHIYKPFFLFGVMAGLRSDKYDVLYY